MKHWENHFMGWLTCLLSTTHQNLTLVERLAFNTSDRKQVKEDLFKCIFEVVLQVGTIGHAANIVMHRIWLKLNKNSNIKGKSWCILLWFEIVLGPIYQDSCTERYCYCWLANFWEQHKLTMQYENEAHWISRRNLVSLV